MLKYRKPIYIKKLCFKLEKKISLYHNKTIF